MWIIVTGDFIFFILLIMCMQAQRLKTSTEISLKEMTENVPWFMSIMSVLFGFQTTATQLSPRSGADTY